MKKIISLILAVLMLLSLAACGSQGVTVNVDDPAATAKDWITAQIENNSLFSFDFDGKEYESHIKSWDKTVEETDAGWTVTYKKDGVVAWSEITFDEELAALEWTNYFKNEGSTDSAVISNILAIDSAVTVENPVLTSAEGSTPLKTDFQSFSVDLTTESYSMKTAGGRSSQDAWPYFDICNGEYGVIGGIGWTGNWKADFTHNKGSVQIAAGMQETKISLHAGEQMRTPMIALQFFKGDQDAGHNAWRKLVFKSYMPVDKTGEPLKYGPLYISGWGGFGEQHMIDQINSLVKSNRYFEMFWIDAGWYGDYTSASIADGIWSQQVGNWYFIPDAYPNGNMAKVGALLKELGKDFILWFEPERAMPGTKLTVEHPEWFLKGSENSSFLLYDFSNDEACDYMTDWVSGTLKESGVTWYRQDFNCNPQESWTKKDAELGENRIGITEIKYITNEYRFLDGLVENNPGLVIDNCASGGKRLDLEMAKRSIPLWRTDYTSSATKYDSTPDDVRSIGQNLSWWLPISCGGWHYQADLSTYNFRSAMSSSMAVPIHFTDLSTINTLVNQYLECREMMAGDYYMLKYGKDDAINTEDACYEYYLAEEGRGYIIAFCPSSCKISNATYVLKGLDANATYELKLVETGETLTMTGQELMTDGIKLNYPKSNFSMLIYFNMV